MTRTKTRKTKTQTRTRQNCVQQTYMAVSLVVQETLTTNHELNAVLVNRGC